MLETTDAVEPSPKRKTAADPRPAAAKKPATGGVPFRAVVAGPYARCEGSETPPGPSTYASNAECGPAAAAGSGCAGRSAYSACRESGTPAKVSAAAERGTSDAIASSWAMRDAKNAAPRSL